MQKVFGISIDLFSTGWINRISLVTIGYCNLTPWQTIYPLQYGGVSSSTTLYATGTYCSLCVVGLQCGMMMPLTLLTLSLSLWCWNSWAVWCQLARPSGSSGSSGYSFTRIKESLSYSWDPLMASLLTGWGLSLFLWFFSIQKYPSMPQIVGHLCLHLGHCLVSCGAYQVRPWQEW